MGAGFALVMNPRETEARIEREGEAQWDTTTTVFIRMAALLVR